MIEEMLRDAKAATVDSDLKRNPVIHKGDEEAPAPMIVNEITDAGYVWVWETRTYERAPVLYYRLGQILRQRRPDGSYRWTLKDPGKLPPRGTIKCLLHPDNPERAKYDRMGFPVCRKSNMWNIHGLEQHMQKKHRSVWEAIKDERDRAERAEDRELRRALLQLQINQQAGTQSVPPEGVPKEEPVEEPAGTPEAPLYVSDKDKNKK
jgi:hypothetical protein